MTFAVSVIVPTYNRAHLIGETLDAILAQTHRPDAVIVVDDGSTDHTSRVVAGFGPRVMYRRLEHVPIDRNRSAGRRALETDFGAADAAADNRGAPAARHAGVQCATTRHIAFCDSDDLWHVDHLDRMKGLFQCSNRLDYAFANFTEFSNGAIAGRTKFDTAPPGFWNVAKLRQQEHAWIIEGDFTDNLICFQPIFPSTVVMTRDLYDRVGGFDPAMSHVPSEDLEFTLRCVRRGPIGVIAHPTVSVRKHAGNTSRSAARQIIGEICVLNHVLKHHHVSGFTRRYIAFDLERRCRAALDLAFACGEMGLVRLLTLAVDRTGLSRKQRLKIRIAAWPEPVARGINGLVTTREFTRLAAAITQYLRHHLALAVRDIVRRQSMQVV